MTAMLIDSGIDSVRDLAGILPAEVSARIEPILLTDPPTAAALRVLATIRDPFWHQHIHAAHIDWRPLLERARQREIRTPNAIRVSLEIAASLAGFPGAHVQLLYASRVMERPRFMAVLDALRIVVEGLQP